MEYSGGSASLSQRDGDRTRRFREAQLPSGKAPEGRIRTGATTADPLRRALLVRLNAHKPAAAESRGERLRRSRAAALALGATFPGVQQLRLELTFEGAAAHTPAAQSHQLYPPARAFFEFPCPYADCDGQFDLTDVVRRAVVDHAHASCGTIVCAGHRALGLSSKQPCRLQLIYSVTALL